MRNELQPANFSQSTNNDLAVIEQSREIAQVQAQHIVAKKFPRDENVVLKKVIKQCQRKSMAEVAMYSYPRGGQNVTGPSIRLAELLANGFGNLEYGIRVLNQTNDTVEAMAYCIDLENNTRKVDYFTVKLERSTKRDGIKKLTDPRDIYEHTQSQVARRVRGCILAIIPGDIVEAAQNQCEATLNSDEEPIQVKIQKIITVFTSLNVSVEMIEKKMGKSINALNNPDILTLRKIYQSLKDGMASIDNFFDVGNSKTANAHTPPEALKQAFERKPDISFENKPKFEQNPEKIFEGKSVVTEQEVIDFNRRQVAQTGGIEPQQIDIEEFTEEDAKLVEIQEQCEQIAESHKTALNSYKSSASVKKYFDYPNIVKDMEFLKANSQKHFNEVEKAKNDKIASFKGE